MSTNQIVIHVEIRAAKGTRINDLVLAAETATMQDVIVAMPRKKWAKDLFKIIEGRSALIPGFMMVLDNRMVQKWELENTQVNADAHLKFVQVVPGG